MIEIFLPTIRWNASVRGLLEHLCWMSREFGVLVSVSDDSETPEKHQFLRRLSAGNSSLRVLIQRPRLGMFRNFAVLFRSASRPYGLLVSDDDWVAPDYVLGAERLLAARPDLAAVMGLFVHLIPDKGAVVHDPVNITCTDPAERIKQYLQVDDGFNHPLYSVFRTAAVQRFSQYAEKHPLAASFFDYLIVFSLLSSGGLVSRQRGPYVYQNTNWSSPERMWESNMRSYAQCGLPDWFVDFHDLYRAVEGFNFLACTLSPIEEPAARQAAAFVVLAHYLRLFKQQVSSASPQWWERARHLDIAKHVEPFRSSSEMLPAAVLDSFLAVLQTASPRVHDGYVRFHDRRDETCD